MRKSLILLTMLLAVATTAIQAQDEPEYRLEIGALTARWHRAIGPWATIMPRCSVSCSQWEP